MLQQEYKRHAGSEVVVAPEHTCVNIASDGEMRVCVDCGVVCGAVVNKEGDYTTSKVKVRKPYVCKKRGAASRVEASPPSFTKVIELYRLFSEEEGATFDCLAACLAAHNVPRYDYVGFPMCVYYTKIYCGDPHFFCHIFGEKVKEKKLMHVFSLWFCDEKARPIVLRGVKLDSEQLFQAFQALFQELRAVTLGALTSAALSLKETKLYALTSDDTFKLAIYISKYFKKHDIFPTDYRQKYSGVFPVHKVVKLMRLN
jgi:hypothetical protein